MVRAYGCSSKTKFTAVKSPGRNFSGIEIIIGKMAPNKDIKILIEFRIYSRPPHGLSQSSERKRLVKGSGRDCKLNYEFSN